MSRAHIRPDILAMHGYVPGAQDPGALKLNTNECPWPPSPAVRAAALCTLDQLPRYPDPQATALREAAAERYGVDAAQVLAGNGSDDCLTVLFRAHLRPGDRVVSPDPTYGLYGTLAAIQGAEHVRVPYDAEWILPDLCGVGARMAIVTSPNNPSGTLAGTDAVRHLCERFDGPVVVDEAYVDFAGPGASLLAHLDDHPNLVVLRTFSKSFSLAGARLGLLFAHRDAVAEYGKVKDSYNVGLFAQAAGVAALKDAAYHRQVVGEVIAERARLAAALGARGWTWPESHANFLLCQVGPEAERVYRGLGEQGVLVRWWGTARLRERLRISVGLPEHTDRLLTALDAL